MIAINDTERSLEGSHFERVEALSGRHALTVETDGQARDRFRRQQTAPTAIDALAALSVDEPPTG